MIKFKPTYFFFFISLFLTACSPKYYLPDTHNVPLISEKGETNIAISGNTQQVEFQASRGITNSIALKANGGFYFPSYKENPIEAEKTSGFGKFFEFGAGYYKPFNENWVFETYGIFGVGTVENDFRSDTFIEATGTLTANLRRFGIQPNIGYKNDFILFGFSSRFVNLSFSDITGNLIYDQVNQQNYLRENNSHFLIEPALTFGLELNQFSFRFQQGASFNLTKSDFQQSDLSFVLTLNYLFKI